MRAFLAVTLSKEMKEELLRIQKLIPECTFKLVEPENLHLTLKFFGDISDKEASKIKEKLLELKFHKFKSNLGKIGVFPNEKFIRIVWVSLEPKEEIEKLNREINKILNNKDEKFESHITLARIKSIKNKQEFMRKLREIKINPTEFQIEKFSLEKSTLTEKGPVYETLEEFKLQ